MAIQNFRINALAIECFAVFFLSPILMYFLRHQLVSPLRTFSLIFTVAAVCCLSLVKNPEFDHQLLLSVRSVKSNVLSIMMIFLPSAIMITGINYLFLQDRFLYFPETKPNIWLTVMLLYPVFLALPQELIFRSFFFHRYRKLFSHPKVLIFCNALSFGLAHLFYGNWIAPSLSFIGGILFAWRYYKSRSLVIVSFEHGLWGNFLFTIGVGWYFYSGAIH